MISKGLFYPRYEKVTRIYQLLLRKCYKCVSLKMNKKVRTNSLCRLGIYVIRILTRYRVGGLVGGQQVRGRPAL